MHSAGISFAATVRERIEAGRRRRDPHHLRTVYNRFLGTPSDAGEANDQSVVEDPNQKMAKSPKTPHAQALAELQVGPSFGETIEDRDDRIDYNEFINAAVNAAPAHKYGRSQGLRRLPSSSKAAARLRVRPRDE